MNMVNEILGLKAESDDLLHLDVMRFVASLGVMVHHSWLFAFPKEMRGLIETQTHNMGLFVDLFFVISGFVITYVYASRMKSRQDFGRFMQRRIGRLLPLHLLTMAVSMAAWFAVLLAGVDAGAMPSWRVECIAATALLVHEIIPCGGLPFNGVNWSISVEMGLYAIFPLLLIRPKLAFVISAAALLVMAGDWYEGYRPIRGLACFSFGMGLYYAKLKPMPPVALAGSTLALVLAMMVGAPTLLCLALVFLTATLAVSADRHYKAGRIVRAIAPLGQLTYSMYMIHYTVFMALAAADRMISGPPMIALIVATHAFVVALSYVSYRYFETPARRWIDAIPLFTRPVTAK